jgi:excisionase family DNA binding protein
MKITTEIEDTPQEDIPEALVQLEAAKTRLLCRLVKPGLAPPRLPEPDQLLTVAEVARRLSFTRQFCYEMIRRGQLVSVRQGKYVRVRLSDLSRWIDEHTEKSA